MKLLKIVFIIIISFILFIYLFFMYEEHLNEDNKIGKMNLKNVKNVHLGMDTTSVLQIMGEPKSKSSFEGEIFYNYNTPNFYSESCQIKFDSKGRVIYK